MTGLEAGVPRAIDRAGEPETLRDRILASRDAILMNPAFRRWASRIPGVRRIARARAREVFDLCAGFVYSQVLYACVRLGFLRSVAAEPRALAELASEAGLPLEGTTRLVEAACALGLLEARSRGRFGLGARGAAIMGDAGILQMIEHNALLYRALADPMALLRGESGTTELGRYFAYASTSDPASLSPAQTGPYTALMSGTVEPLAEEVFDAGVLPSRGRLVDVGGGDGHFAILVAQRHPELECVIFDLPSVVDRAGRRVRAMHLGDRVHVAGGDFHKSPLPGADVVTLVRVLLDHDDESAAALLASVRRSLRPGGRVVIVEPLAGDRDARAVGEVYFALYLTAMGQGRARRPDVMRALLASAGFSRSAVVGTRYPVHTGIILGFA